MTSGDTEEGYHTWVGPSSRALTIGVSATAEDLIVREMTKWDNNNLHRVRELIKQSELINSRSEGRRRTPFDGSSRAK
jgi:hypothetical protein